MFRLSTRGDYGLLFMTALAKREGRYLSLAEIGKYQHISVPYLAKLTRVLKKAGLVESKEGLGGGYRLAKKPSEISVMDVLTCLEENTAPVKCLEGKACPSEKGCVTKEIFGNLYEEIVERLSKITLEDIVKKNQKNSDLITLGK